MSTASLEQSKVDYKCKEMCQCRNLIDDLEVDRDNCNYENCKVYRQFEKDKETDSNKFEYKTTT